MSTVLDHAFNFFLCVWLMFVFHMCWFSSIRFLIEIQLPIEMCWLLIAYVCVFWQGLPGKFRKQFQQFESLAVSEEKSQMQCL